MNTVAARAGVYFAALQFLFALCWTVYVVYLPALAARAGIAAGSVILVLMLDQAIFALMDFAMGVAADRVAAAYARLARLLLAVTLASCAAFLLLPFVPGLPGGAGIFLALVVLWSASSSALRAPPLALIGRYAALPAHPWLAAFYLLGLGVAGALSPFLGARLKAFDPAVPFVVASAALAAVTLGLAWAARALAQSDKAPPAQGIKASAVRAEAPMVPAASPAGPKPGGGAIALFLAGALLAAAGFQLHSALNSAPQYLRFAKPPELEHLLPLFWVGFNLAIFPMAALARRAGAMTVMAGAGIAGAAALAAAWQAQSLAALVGAQLAAGAAWSAMLVCAMTAALALGHVGREGKVNGALFALLAIATFARMGMVAAQLQQSLSPLLPALALAAWAAAGVLFLAAWLALRRGGAREVRAALVGER